MYCSLILMLKKIQRQSKCIERQKIKRQRLKNRDKEKQRNELEPGNKTSLVPAHF